MTKYYELKPGDKAYHGEILFLKKVDGMYVHWLDEKGKIRIGNSFEYELKDGIYYPVK